MVLLFHPIGQNYVSQNASSIRELTVYLIGHSCSYAETVIALAQHISFPHVSTQNASVAEEPFYYPDK